MHGDFLDNIDIDIIETLQKAGRTKRGELADQVGLSIPSISERLLKLEQHGIIKGYHAVLDPRKLGLEVTAYIFLISESSTHYPDVIKLAVKKEEILECHAITGEGSHLLKVRVANMSRLERLLSEIQSWPGIKNTNTDIVLSTAKETSDLSLAHLREKK
jgi:Lrp/AsnC family leucine-responsive transcriptional regulator